MNMNASIQKWNVCFTFAFNLQLSLFLLIILTLGIAENISPPFFVFSITKTPLVQL